MSDAKQNIEAAKKNAAQTLDDTPTKKEIKAAAKQAKGEIKERSAVKQIKLERKGATKVKMTKADKRAALRTG